MFRYTMVSVVSTAVSTFVLFVVYGELRVWTEVPSTLFANLVATVPSYYLNRRWAWGKTGRSHLRREVLPFWSLSVAGIMLSIVTETGARHIGLEYFNHDHSLRTVLVLAANLAAFGILWVVKFLVFNRLFHVSVLHADQPVLEASMKDPAGEHVPLEPEASVN